MQCIMRVGCRVLQPREVIVAEQDGLRDVLPAVTALKNLSCLGLFFGDDELAELVGVTFPRSWVMGVDWSAWVLSRLAPLFAIKSQITSLELYYWPQGCAEACASHFTGLQELALVSSTISAGGLLLISSFLSFQSVAWCSMLCSLLSAVEMHNDSDFVLLLRPSLHPSQWHAATFAVNACAASVVLIA